MTLCFRGKKSKQSEPINKRLTSEKHHALDLTNNHQNKTSNMPHDLSRSSANSASSSTFSYSHDSTTDNNNHYYHKNSKMDISDDEDEDEPVTTNNKDDDSKQQKKLKRTFDNLTPAQQKIVNADMIFYCFEILGNHLFKGKHHTSSQLIPTTSSSIIIIIITYSFNNSIGTISIICYMVYRFR